MEKIPVNLFMWFIAVLPILFLLAAIAGIGWSAAKAGVAGLLIASVTAVLCYRAQPASLICEALKGGWSALSILLVIWPAIFIYELTCEIHGFQAIRIGISRLTGHKLLQIFILGWIFPSFLQGITGFGVAVAVGAPLLISIGLRPLWSIIIVLLCHSWGGTFGTLALAWQALVAQTGISGADEAAAARTAAAYILIYIVISPLLVCWFYGKWKAIREGLPLVILFSAILGGGQFLLSGMNATVACFLPTILALGCGIGATRLGRYQKKWELEDSPVMESDVIKEEETASRTSFQQAFLPYYLLSVITIVCLLIPPVNHLLNQWQIGFSFPGHETGYGFVTAAEAFFSPIKPLTYAGTFLAVSSMISYFYYRSKRLCNAYAALDIFRRTAKKALPSSGAILCFIIMSKIMGSSGQIYELAYGIVGVLGEKYILLAPLLGMTGAFITSSNMSSNILLGSFQLSAAAMLNLSPVITLALQTAGGVLGTAFSPGSVIMGVSTTGMAGSEGKILRLVLPVTLGCALLFGVIGYICFT